MIEVTKEQFEKIISRMPYSTSFLIGQQHTTRYNAKKGFLKGSMFAKRINEKDGAKYYVNKSYKKILDL